MNLSVMTDEELVAYLHRKRKNQAEVTECLRELSNRLLPRIIAWLKLQESDSCLYPDSIGEAARELFNLFIAKAILKYDPQRSKLTTFFYRVLHNLFIDEYKQKWRKRLKGVTIFSLDDTKTDRVDFSDKEKPGDKMKKEMREIIIEEIEDLSNENWKAALKLSLEGCTAKEIAESTSRPEGTVKSDISRAKKELEKLLKTKMA
ncbi:MAG: sigma-70 family RNA polymerase sigma factor [Candidatus Omnitrophota bacterium]